MKSDSTLIREILERLIRLESRLVQLMLYSGASPDKKYENK